MTRFVLKRLLLVIPTLLVVTFVVFLLINITPSNPGRIILGAEVPQELVDEMNHELGYDLPVVQRYFHWLSRAIRGEFGESYYTGRDVFTEIGARLPYTLLLALLSLGLAIIIGLPLGVLCAVKQYSIADTTLSTLAMFLAAMPTFWLGLLLLLQFALRMGILPSGGIDSGWTSWILPTASLSMGYMASYLRYTRSAMLDNIRQDYVRTAESKGCSPTAVTWKHAFRNSMMTLVTYTGISLSNLVGGAIVTESIFSIPGLGTMVVTAIRRKDIPQVLAALVVLGGFFLVMMLIIDILYAFIDPRIRAKYSMHKSKKQPQKEKAVEQA